MMSAIAIARRVRAPLSRIMSSRKKLPGDLCPYSTYYDLASPLAPLIKDAKEQACIPTLAYAVRRSDTVLVGPASPTPRETKSLSDLDDIDVMRMHMSMALFYRGGGVDGVHPAGVIRRALAKALVHYYPLAGRLREIEGRKLVVDCTGEGVLFVQADADVQLADLEAAGPGHGLSPPFPCWDQLLFDVEGSGGLLNTPIMLIQVTRFLCGGFVVALRFSHTICDGIGISQFMNAVGELARGLPSMTVTPVWCRELIMHGAQPRGNSTPPRAGCTPTSGSVSVSATNLRRYGHAFFHFQRLRHRKDQEEPPTTPPRHGHHLRGPSRLNLACSHRGARAPSGRGCSIGFPCQHTRRRRVELARGVLRQRDGAVHHDGKQCGLVQRITGRRCRAGASGQGRGDHGIRSFHG